MRARARTLRVLSPCSREQRDLEIRGSGSLLGADQSGDVHGMGFELYMQMLREELAASRAALPPRPAGDGGAEEGEEGDTA